MKYYCDGFIDVHMRSTQIAWTHIFLCLVFLCCLVDEILLCPVIYLCLVYEILFCLVILDSLMGAERDGWDTELTFDFCAKWLLSRPNLSAPRNYGTSIR